MIKATQNPIQRREASRKTHFIIVRLLERSHCFALLSMNHGNIIDLLLSFYNVILAHFVS